MIRDYQASDMVDLYRDDDKHASDAQMASVMSAPNNYVWTVEVDGVPVAVIGLFIRWEGVGDAWAVVGDSARGKGIAMTRAIRGKIKWAFDAFNLRRLAVTIRDGNEEYERWVKALGFEYEGIEVSAAPDGGDLYRFRWLR